MLIQRLLKNLKSLEVKVKFSDVGRKVIHRATKEIGEIKKVSLLYPDRFIEVEYESDKRFGTRAFYPLNVNDEVINKDIEFYEESTQALRDFFNQTKKEPKKNLDQKQFWCNHRWKKTYGISQVWEDCELCGVKKEDAEEFDWNNKNFHF